MFALVNRYVVQFQSSPVRIGRALGAVNFTSPVRLEVSILARPHWTGALSRVFHGQATNQFQSSPVRIGRALFLLPGQSLEPPEFQSSPVRIGRALSLPPSLSHTVEVSILARPHWTGALTVGNALTASLKVSILARPHWTGAPKAATSTPKTSLFQSSPVRIGRALFYLYDRGVKIRVSILARPHWTGAQRETARKLRIQNVSILARPHWTGAHQPRRQGRHLVESFNPRPSALDGRSTKDKLIIGEGLFQSSPVRIGRALAEVLNGIREGDFVSILARPHWTGARL